jgi:hypothetical protein
MKRRQLMFFSFELACSLKFMRCIFCARETTTHKILTTNHRAVFLKPVRRFTPAM